MYDLPARHRRILLRDFVEADRVAFTAYQNDPLYRRLHDFDDSPERPGQLFDLFLRWQHDQPRQNLQLAICEASTGRLLGCGGLRNVSDGVAVLGIELAPAEWGRHRLALDATTALLQLGFETLNLMAITGDTASGNRRVERLARWFGAEIVAQRPGADWMQARGWQELDWRITREQWQHAKRRAR